MLMSEYLTPQAILPDVKATRAKCAHNVVTHKGFRPEDLPEIARNQEWKQASPGQRDKACRTIRDMARALLIRAGYSRDIVYRNIP